MSSHPPWLLPPASCSSRGLWDVAGACHSLPSAAELWAPRASEYQAELREERAPPGTLPTGKRPRSLALCPAPSLSCKVFPTQRPTPRDSPRVRRGSGFSQADVSAIDEFGGEVGGRGGEKKYPRQANFGVGRLQFVGTVLSPREATPSRRSSLSPLVGQTGFREPP